MSEQHLKNGLDQLPKYMPEPEVWEDIKGQLHLHEAIQQLPTYEPAPAVWEQISAAIEPKARIRTLWQRVAATAAVLALTIGTYYWTKDAQAQETIFYATGQIETGLFEEDWNTDEDGFQALAKLCSQKQFACKTPDFQVLKSEFEELNDAKASIELAMRKYGKQADFILQIKDIEQERSKVLKELFAMI